MANLIEQHHALTLQLDQFFNEFPESNRVDRELTQMLHITLSSPETEHWNARERSNAIFMVNRVTQLVRSLNKIYETDDCQSTIATHQS